MIKYAKIINEETGLCEVGLGTNTDFYKSVGMIEQDVEQSDVDYNWYITEKCPHKSEEEKLNEAKEAKYAEANLKAFEYLESGEAVYEYEEGKSIEATDGNIAKLGLALVNFILQQDYTSTIEWNTKENQNVQLNAEQLQVIVAGLQSIQAEVWTVKFPAYNTAISEAETTEEVNAIEINYAQDIYKEEIEEENEL